MPIPSGLTAITVTSAYPAIDGTPLTGSVLFETLQPIMDATGKVKFSGSATRQVFRGVMQPIVLPCTDNTALNPTGFSYKITETINGVAQTPYWVSLPSTLGATVDLSALTPAATPPNASAFATANTWTSTQTFDGNPPAAIPAGAVSGYVLTSDATGNATWQPSTGGGGGAVSSVFGRTGAVTANPGDYTAAQVGAASLAGAAFTGTVTVTESAAAGGALVVTNSHTTPTAPTAQYVAQSAADLVTGISVSGDTVARQATDSNGKMTWGPGGSSATDTNLYRTAAGILRTDTAFQVGTTLNAANGSMIVSTGATAFAYASSAGQAFKVTNTTTSPTSPTTQLVAKSAADATLGVQVTGDTQQRLAVDSNGKHTWGSGSATGDVVLQRSAAGVLQLTTGQLSMNSQKIVSVANGSASNDAAAFGQVLPIAGGTMTGALSPAVATLTFGSTIAVNAALGNAFALTLTASTGTLSNPTNPVDGQTIRVRVIQDATGNRTLAYGTAYDFGTAGAPTLTTTASKVDILGFEYVASLSKWCYLGAGLGF